MDPASHDPAHPASTAPRAAGSPSTPQPPPVIRGVPLLRELPLLVSKPLDFLLHGRQTHGDVYTVDLGLTRVTLLHHPRHAQHVLRDQAARYRKGGALWDAIRTLIGNGLPASEGEFWRRQRRMMQPHFHRERLAALVAAMVDAIQEGLAPLDAAAASGRPIDLVPELTNITMKVIVKTMFGTEIERRDADIIAAEMGYVLDFMLRGLLFNALPGWMPVPGRKRYERAVRAIDDVVYRIIDKRRRAGGSSGDLISMLLDSVDAETDQRMTNEEVRDEAVTIFLAGYETTSVAVSWAGHYLTRDPGHAEALRREVDEVLGDRAPAFADVPNLRFARMVFEESLRLYSPAYRISRQAVEDDEIDGWRIPKGSLVFVVVHSIHRHPDVWDRPEEFDPLRFSPDRSASRPPMSWIPFGVGQRICIGKDFALTEGPLILAMLAQRYSMKPVPGREVDVQVGATLRMKNGLWVTLERRQGR